MKQEIFRAQREFCEAVLAGDKERIEVARARMTRLQKARRIQRETSHTLRAALDIRL
jgi:hypothetical protein